MKVPFFSLIFASACAHHPYLANDLSSAPSEENLRQCLVPVMYGIAYDVPPSKDLEIESALEYWNDATGLKLFFSLGRIDDADLSRSLDSAILMIHATDLDLGRRYALTGFEYAKNGCFTKVRIVISQDAFATKDGILETIVRHEAGHALGLAHSPAFSDLMFHSVEPTMQHPVDASSEEVNAVRDLYSKR